MLASTVGLTFLAVCAQTLGNIALRQGLKMMRAALSWKSRLQLFWKQPYFAVAIALLAAHLFLWIQVLRTTQLSVAVPLTAFSHVLNAALAGPLLGETLPARRWLGTGLIVLGIWLVLP